MTDDQWQMKDVGLAESFLAAICHLSSIFHLSFVIWRETAQGRALRSN